MDGIQFHSPDDVNNGITLQFLGYGAAALDDPNPRCGGRTTITYS